MERAAEEAAGVNEGWLCLRMRLTQLMLDAEQGHTQDAMLALETLVRQVVRIYPRVRHLIGPL